MHLFVVDCTAAIYRVLEAEQCQAVLGSYRKISYDFSHVPPVAVGLAYHFRISIVRVHQCISFS